MMDEEKGWYDKYLIMKADGEPVDPEGVFFVLRLDTDPAAREAALVYAAAVISSDPELAAALRATVKLYPHGHGTFGWGEG